MSELQVNILLVDDRPENLLAMESILGDLGQNLVRATSGREALRYLLDEDFALILLDVQMPVLNGFELAELIRERERTQRTPIIFISAVSKNEQYIFKGYSLGAVDYLTKPFEPEILRSKVKFFTELYKQNQKIKRQAELLEQANTELDRLNSQLEIRVRERTAQLQNINKELEDEIYVRKEAEARLATEHSITRTLADAISLETAASPILKSFCEHLKAEVALLWLLDSSNTSLSCKHIETSRWTGDLSSFIAESRRVNFSKGTGLPGQVWQKNATVWVPDTIKGDKYPRATFAASVGLHSAVAFPIKIGRKFYGVIEFFTRQPLPANQPLLNMVEAIGSEIGQFIQRKRVEVERENLLLREKSLREQAETASRLKDEFLATVSHELRTPLNSILGWCQMIQTGRLEVMEQDRALETIHRNAKVQAQLIDDLLDTSRLITGNLRLNLTPTQVIPVIESAVDVVRPAAEAKGITISTVYNSDLQTVTCDPQRLQQMIWNLLTNSVKFTPPEGRVEVRLERKNKELQIIVSDTGQGINPEFLPFVFERFRQADSSITRRQGGLGLGLAIVRHLAELHGGSIRATSDGQGLGSTFTVTLPASHEAEIVKERAHKEVKEHKQSNNSDNELTNVRILIVEDDDDTREMMTYVLDHWGAQTQASASVAEAMAALTKWQPDVILADLSMPDEDGYALLSKIRSQTTKDYSKTPVIALTAHAHPEDSKKALSAGFQLHLPKPIDVQQLAQAILNVTGKNN